MHTFKQKIAPPQKDSNWTFGKREQTALSARQTPGLRPAEAGLESHFAYDFTGVPLHTGMPVTIQPKLAKLAVSTPGDSYEQEADRISEQVMRMPELPGKNAAVSAGSAGPEHKSLQTKSVQAGNSAQIAVPPLVNEVLRSPGKPLDPATRAFMEPRFGHDFSHVRVHSDAAAGQSARDINANAYTVGRDIVFGAGQYAPGTTRGRHMLAHELTHVIQQDGTRAEEGGTVRLQRQSFSDYLKAMAPGLLPAGATQLIHSAKQPIDDLAASVYESEQHMEEFFKSEVFEPIKNHFREIVTVTIGLILAEIIVGALLAAPDPSLLTKVIAVILQIAIIAFVAITAGLELKNAIEEGKNWLSTATKANGNPIAITMASFSFLRMVWHIIMAVLALASLRAKIRGGLPSEAGATTGSGGGQPLLSEAAEVRASIGSSRPIRTTPLTAREAAINLQKKYRKIDMGEETLAGLEGIFRRSMSGKRTVTPRPGQYLPSHTQGAAGELDAIRVAQNNPAVTKIRVIPSKGGKKAVRTPDLQLETLDGSILVEVRTLTGGRRGYQAAGNKIRIETEPRFIVDAIRAKIFPSNKPSQLAGGGNLVIQIRRGGLNIDTTITEAVNKLNPRLAGAQFLQELEFILPKGRVVRYVRAPTGLFVMAL